jgi:hypothetical protein
LVGVGGWRVRSKRQDSANYRNSTEAFVTYRTEGIKKTAAARQKPIQLVISVP